jgi:hypothetical protein
MNVSRLFNDMEVETKVLPIDGSEIASKDRTHGDSYRLELTLRVRVPIPSQTIDQISRNDPKLADALPALPALVESASPSPAFKRLYDLKIDSLRGQLNRIDSLLSRHNFYDCDTVLDLKNPATGRRALLIQADMDVNTDGSDGDRNFVIDGSSMFFQPQTSYRWPRQTTRTNPFLATYGKRLAALKADFAKPGLSPERNRQIRDQIKTTEATLYELRHYSFLIAGNDPYIVLPGFMVRDGKGPLVPKIGDYAAVIHDGVIYPAIVGDIGPSFKMGEASVRLCQQINPRSSSISRPVSSLKVTYLIFPDSLEQPFGPPDLDHWRTRCQALLDELGGTAIPVFEWTSLIQPWPTPTPTPTPSPTPSPTPAPASSPATSSSPPAPAETG